MTEPAPSSYANLRDGFAALREFIIVLAMMALLFVPGRVKSVLDAAGIRSLAGVEFDTDTLAESEAEVEQAHTHIVNLKRQLTLARQELSQVALHRGPVNGDELSTVLQRLAKAQRETIETETNLNRSQQKNRDLLKRHGVSMDAPSSDDVSAVTAPSAELAQQWSTLEDTH